MVFDWFKRKFVKKEDASDASPIEPSESSVEESSASAETPVEESPPQVQPDYLSWAREFTFIQNQRTPPPESPPEYPKVEKVEQVEEVRAVTPEAIPEPQPAPEPLASNVAEVQEIQKVEPIQAPEPEAQPASGLPTTEEGYLALIRSWKQEEPPVEPAASVNPVVEAVQSPEIAQPLQPTYEPIQEPKPVAQAPIIEPPPPAQPAPVFEVSEPVIASSPTTPEISEPKPETTEDEDEKMPFWRKAFNWNRGASPETVVTPEIAEPSQPVQPIQPVQEPEPLAQAPVVEPPPPAQPVQPAPVFEASEPVIASSPTTPEISEPKPETTEDEDEKMPFWRKAFNWNRGASTSDAATGSVSSPELIPEEAFDEGFLWSAEVLSAQGRRPEDVTVEEITWLKKLRKGLQRTSRGLVNDLKAVVGKGPISADDLDDIENLLLSADVGVASTERIIDALKVRVKKESLSAEAVFDFLKTQLKEQLEFDDPVSYAPKRGELNVWLIVGVNGVGKTTTIGKLAHLAQQSGYKTLVAAGDTFRAAAVEQLQEWGRRSGVEVIANKGKNADPAAVVFDGIVAAQARGSELLLVDTAGRLQNKKNLMEELAKIRRIIDKKATGAHIEALLVLDASTGQNGLVQAKVFSEVANLSGVILTKLDGTARGGVALAVVEELKIPIRFIGVGEKINDLRPFNGYEFVEALLSDQS
jgi:fused signal recognition particle receptor